MKYEVILQSTGNLNAKKTWVIIVNLSQLKSECRLAVSSEYFESQKYFTVEIEEMRLTIYGKDQLRKK